MGYRLDIDTKSNYYELSCGNKYDPNKPSFYGGKLFGYCDTEKLKSYQYLCEIGKLDKNKYYYWGDGAYYEIELTPKECEDFCKLYIEDVIKEYKYKTRRLHKYKKERLEELDKLVKCGENVILWWG